MYTFAHEKPKYEVDKLCDTTCDTTNLNVGPLKGNEGLNASIALLVGRFEFSLCITMHLLPEDGRCALGCVGVCLGVCVSLFYWGLRHTKICSESKGAWRDKRGGGCGSGRIAQGWYWKYGRG